MRFLEAVRWSGCQSHNRSRAIPAPEDMRVAIMQTRRDVNRLVGLADEMARTTFAKGVRWHHNVAILAVQPLQDMETWPTRVARLCSPMGRTAALCASDVESHARSVSAAVGPSRPFTHALCELRASARALRPDQRRNSAGRRARASLWTRRRPGFVGRLGTPWGPWEGHT